MLDTDASAAFVPPDRLVFVRGDVLLAVRFDPEQGTVIGQPIPVAQPIGRDEGTFSDTFSVSPDVLAYRTTGGGQRRQLVWTDRNGTVLQPVGSPDDTNIGSPELDPAGERVAISRSVLRNFDGWLIDAARGTETRFTFGAGVQGLGVWSPDGQRFVFVSYNEQDLYEKSASGAGSEQLLVKDAGIPLSWSPDGRFLLYARADARTGTDLWVLPMTGERKPTIAVQYAVAPDGRFLLNTIVDAARLAPAVGLACQTAIERHRYPDRQYGGLALGSAYVPPIVDRMIAATRAIPVRA